MTGVINIVDNGGINLLTGTTTDSSSGGSSGGGYGYFLDLDLTYSTDTINDTNNIIYDSLII